MTRFEPLPFVLGAACAGLIACGGSTAQSAPAPTGSASPAVVGRASQSAAIGGCTPPTSGEDIRTTDVNDDGLPEVCKYYRTVDDPERPGQRKSLLVRQDLDVNWDGKVDIKRVFSSEGVVTREEWDADYDGRVDEVRTFEEGKIVRSERDQDNDGRMEVVRFYAAGKLERKETDTNGDGKPDRWEYFKRREVDRVGIDKDFDGKPDSWAKAPNRAAGGS